MSLIARLLRYLFWVVVISWSVAILRRFLNQMGNGGRPKQDMNMPSDALTQKLVRDPVCGTHVAQGLALPLKLGADTLFFCSADCRDRYLSKTQKHAASA